MKYDIVDKGADGKGSDGMGNGICITRYILRGVPQATETSAAGEKRNQEPNPLANIDATWA